jgi:hypothetical protein
MFNVIFTRRDLGKAIGIVLETLVTVSMILAVYHFVLR